MSLDPWKTVRIRWTSGEKTETSVRRSEIVPYLSNLPIERIESFEFGPYVHERGASPAGDTPL